MTEFALDFPGGEKPQLFSRSGNSINYVSSAGIPGSIALTELDDGISRVTWAKKGDLDPFELFRGPSAAVEAAFEAFSAKATARPDTPAIANNVSSSRPVSDAVQPAAVINNAAAYRRPSPNALLAFAAFVVAVVVAGAVFVKIQPPADQATDGKQASALEALNAAIAKMNAPQEAPQMPAAIAALGAPAAPSKGPALVPGATGTFKTVKVRKDTEQTDETKVPEAGMERPAATAALPAGAVPVPKDLPPLQLPAAVTEAIKPAIAKVAAAPVLPAFVPPAAAAATPPSAPPAAAKFDPEKQASVALPAVAPAAAPVAPAEAAAEKPAVVSDKPATDDKKAPPMTPAEAQQLLAALEAVKTQAQDGQDLSPELLRQLPHDVAARLVGSGISTVSPVERAESAKRMARIVRLPPEVINNHRGRDGIASIPEADTWVSNGGRISIPLPGGGDIQEPGMLKEFGLQP